MSFARRRLVLAFVIQSSAVWVTLPGWTAETNIGRGGRKVEAKY